MTKAISFCSTCRNRLGQLQQTLPQNLGALGERHEIVLVDYGSTDGLSDWVWGHFRDAIAHKKLVFFEVKNEVRWNMARAKNPAHRLATGGYLFNLDADNFVTVSDIDVIEKAAEMDLHSWQYSGVMTDGSCGRLGVPQKLFTVIGGYDETLLAMGGQDIDLLDRLGFLQKKRARLPPPALPAVQNSMDGKLQEIGRSAFASNSADELYSTLESINRKISRFKLQTEGLVRLGGGFSYQGLLNGESVVINGFDHITHVSRQAS